MEKKAYLVSFLYEEKRTEVMSDAFGLDHDRAIALSAALVVRMADAVKKVTKENPASATAIVMDYFDDLEPEERGPFMATAMVAYFKAQLGQLLAKRHMTEALRKFFEQMGGVSSGPG